MGSLSNLVSEMMPNLVFRLGSSSIVSQMTEKASLMIKTWMTTGIDLRYFNDVGQ